MSSSADQKRIVIDETSFDFNEVEASQVELLLGQFNDTLHDLRFSGLKASKPPMFADTMCRGEQDLYSYLSNAVDRDVMLRFFSLLDKCPEWNADYPRCDEAAIGGKARRSAWSVCFAVTAAVSGHGVACLVFPRFEQHGFLEIDSDLGQCEVFFFASMEELVHFWRGLYELEDVPEQEFFESLDRAFPSLIFHPDLTFRRFQGSYLDLRKVVIRHLGELNDRFLEEYRAFSAIGRVSDVESYFSSRGVGGISRESVRTRKSAGLMHKREVEFNGSRVICEWHTKLKPQIDRIHFAFGPEFGGKILIGIFVDHLPL